jgi:hypothetical protein
MGSNRRNDSAARPHTLISFRSPNIRANAREGYCARSIWRLNCSLRKFRNAASLTRDRDASRGRRRPSAENGVTAYPDIAYVNTEVRDRAGAISERIVVLVWALDALKLT